jgi:hypothetical protein
MPKNNLISDGELLLFELSELQDESFRHIFLENRKKKKKWDFSPLDKF